MAAPTNGGRTLSRDYKGVRRHAHVAVTHAYNGWIGFGVGLAAGLAVALGVHLHYRGQLAAQAEPVPAPAKLPASEAAPDEGVVGAAPDTGEGTPGFDFYEMLPKQEVEVPAKPSAGRTPAAKTPLPTGGAVLQAGSFKQATEAEKMVAQLALHGVDAKIQRASVDDETWYRVRIGPIATVEELRSVQSRLREAEIAAAPVNSVDEVPLP